LSFNLVCVSNATIFKPLGFYIRGFSSLQQNDYYFIFMLVLYICTLLANILIMSIIWFTESLHTPKYIAVFSLAVVDISYSTALIPKSVDIFIFNSRFVFYDPCLTQMFFVHYFSAMESFALSVLAYDRLIAICFPLRSNTLNTNRRMILIVTISWTVPFIVVLSMVSLISRLSFCRSTTVFSAEHGFVYVLACMDTSFNRKLGNWLKTLVALLFPLFFILSTYMIILFIVLKIASTEQRQKAFQTCLSHLLCAFVYYIPIILTYILANLRLITSLDVLTSLLITSVILPPMLNPVIYWFNTEELKVKLLHFFKRNKTFPR
uniref:Odorant receptor, family D, subfamily 107, member 1 n=1 Tax=Erpetoichthys calabaricus TaxID=27687 RepID=A0A8C4RRM7_ERPCA